MMRRPPAQEVFLEHSQLGGRTPGVTRMALRTGSTGSNRPLIAVRGETFPDGPKCSLRAGGQVELAQDIADVSTSRPLADHELGRNLLVRLARGDHPQDLSLAIGELPCRVLAVGRPHRSHQTL